MIDRSKFNRSRAQAVDRHCKNSVQRGVVLPGSSYKISIAGKPPINVSRLGGAFQNGETAIAFVPSGTREGRIVKQDKR